MVPVSSDHRFGIRQGHLLPGLIPDVLPAWDFLEHQQADFVTPVQKMPGRRIMGGADQVHAEGVLQDIGILFLYGFWHGVSDMREGLVAVQAAQLCLFAVEKKAAWLEHGFPVSEQDLRCVQVTLGQCRRGCFPFMGGCRFHGNGQLIPMGCVQLPGKHIADNKGMGGLPGFVCRNQERGVQDRNRLRLPILGFHRSKGRQAGTQMNRHRLVCCIFPEQGDIGAPFLFHHAAGADLHVHNGGLIQNLQPHVPVDAAICQVIHNTPKRWNARVLMGVHTNRKQVVPIRKKGGGQVDAKGRIAPFVPANPLPVEIDLRGGHDPFKMEHKPLARMAAVQGNLPAVAADLSADRLVEVGEGQLPACMRHIHAPEGRFRIRWMHHVRGKGFVELPVEVQGDPVSHVCLPYGPTVPNLDR
jgi:hypothetical protein